MIKTRADAAPSAIRPGLVYQNLYFNAASRSTSRSPQHLCSFPDHRIVNAVHSRKSAVHDDFYLIADSFPDCCTVTSDLSKGGIFPVPVLRFSRRLRLYRDPFKYHIIPALGLIFVPGEGPVITKDDRTGTIFVLRLQTLDFSVLVISNN